MAGKRLNLGWWIFAIAVIGTPLAYYLFIGGRVDGVEFSPDDFSRRSFSYNIMPIFNICISGIEYRDKTPVFEQTLRGDGYLGKQGETADSTRRWHLVRDTRSNPESRDFDAVLLVRFLDLVDDNHESMWNKWNEDFPDLAATFWPIVADMARSYLYVELTEIMARARILTADGVDDFEKFMVDKASSAFLAHAQRLNSEGSTAEALVLYQKSFDLSPSQSAAAGKIECLKRLGENEKAAGEFPAEVEND